MAEDLGQRSAQNEKGKLPTNVTEWKNYLRSPETDFHVYEKIISLRQDVESPENWTRTKELAKQELISVPEDIIPQIFERLQPYLEELPGGHSKKHVYRDFINSLAINQNPWIKVLDSATTNDSNEAHHDIKVDDVERFIGIIGGTFHDIGNSVVNRYEEADRFAGHAEAGAFLLGEITRDLLPPNILKLSQFAIAAHTHYMRDIPVTREKKNVTKKPYKDALNKDGDKAGIWFERWADRLDMQGVQGFIRSAIVRAEPIKDFNGQEFIIISPDEITDFKHHFAPTAQKGNILEHIATFKNSALGKSAYSEHDTAYFRDALIRPNTKEQEEFVTEVLKETPVLPEVELNEKLETFYSMCKLVDGGKDIKTVIDLFKRKFPSLPKDQLSHWANGFSILPRLYDQALLRMEEELREVNGDPKQAGIIKEAGRLALQKLEELKKSS